ncbi:MAG: hydrogen peroxide-inducible genes activator [Bacteroidales bacterium]|nr:hydrogen peroxide-inducible genes activator [Bacteroidales bacterium]
MTIKQLQYFKELLHYGSFTRAASKLGLSQPALSAQIKKLEVETELSLIDRNAKPLVLTGDGEKFYEEALEILQRFDALKNFPDHFTKEIKGELQVGMIPTLAPYFVSIFINDLQREYPELKLVIEELITEDIIHKIRTGHLDAGIISTPVEVRKMKFRPLFYERFFLYVSDSHQLYGEKEVSLEDFSMEDIWYLQEGNCFRNQVNSICNLAGIRTGSQILTYSSNSLESLRRIVESRSGITFIPELATINVPSDREEMIKPIKGNDHYREISLVFESLYNKKRLLDAFLEVALRQLPSHMKKRPPGMIMDTELKVGI